MIKIEFTAEEIKTLDYERYNHPHPRVQRKMETLLLKSHNIQHKQIVKLAGISPNTVTKYLLEYKDGGVEKLREIHFNQPKSKLVQHTSTIEDYFRKYPPATIKEAMGKIEELTGLKRSETQIRKFLKSIGMNCRKVGMLPSKADPDKQEAFKKEQLEPLLNEAKEGKRAVFL